MDLRGKNHIKIICVPLDICTRKLVVKSLLLPISEIYNAGFHTNYVHSSCALCHANTFVKGHRAVTITWLLYSIATCNINLEVQCVHGYATANLNEFLDLGLPSTCSMWHCKPFIFGLAVTWPMALFPPWCSHLSAWHRVAVEGGVGMANL